MEFRPKKKWNFLHFFMACMILGQSCCGQKRTFNYDFQNTDGNGKPIGWFFNLKGPKQIQSYLVSLDSVNRIKNRCSLSITKINDDANYGTTGYTIPLTFKGNELELKGYIKTENVRDGYAGLWVRVDRKDKMLALNNMSDQALAGTTDWKEYTIKIPYDDEKATKIVVGCLLAGKGKAWFGDIKLFIDGNPIENAQVKTVAYSKAELDTEFRKKSRIDTILTGKQETRNLTLFGEVWGFLKYFHPSVQKGDYNMDAELFRILPSIISAKSNKELSNIIEKWVNKFGAVSICRQCNVANCDDIATKADYGRIFDHSVFSSSLIGKLKEILANSHSNSIYYIEFSSNGNPIFKNEISYSEMLYPDPGYRLLTLFRYWNMIQYFYPYKSLIGQNWDDTLSKFIPQFVRSSNQTEYVLTTLKLIASIHDSHGNIWSWNEALQNFKGRYTFPFQARFIQNKLTITGFYLDTLNTEHLLKKGDVIVAIDGKKIERLISKYLPLTPASNLPSQMRDLPNSYLLRSNKQVESIRVDRDGQERNIDIDLLELQKVNKTIDYNPSPNALAYKILDGNIGYLFPGRYKNNDLKEIENAFKNTKGMIIDMRCYPSDFMPFTFVPYVKHGDENFAKFIQACSENLGYFRWSTPLSDSGKNVYKQKVIVIVNELTQSQAEYTTMALQSSPNVTVIGSTTAGADGDVSTIMLPGGISTLISGIGILYPDGTATQRRGLKIDYKINPTINGVKKGRDELLEMAKKIIMQSNYHKAR